MISPLRLILSVVYGLLILWLIYLFYQVGPTLQQRLWPTIVDQSVGNLERTRDLFCFDWTYTKAEDRELLNTILYLRSADGVNFAAAEVQPRLNGPSNASSAAKKGETRTIRECAAVALPIKNSTPLTFTGVKVYRGFFGQWTVDQPLPTLAVDFAPHD